LGSADNERNAIGFSSLVRSGEDDKAVKDYFKPEFRNRLDAVIKFNKLDKTTIKKVAAKFVLEMQDQLAEKNIKVELAESAWDYLVDKGYDPQMGARPMSRLIHEKIKVPLAKKILFDKLENNVTINVIAHGDVLELSVAGQAVLH
jgi:ATP-dependent Clp protease ATP-binding subunit ClpA